MEGVGEQARLQQRGGRTRDLLTVWVLGIYSVQPRYGMSTNSAACTRPEAHDHGDLRGKLRGG